MVGTILTINDIIIQLISFLECNCFLLEKYGFFFFFFFTVTLTSYAPTGMETAVGNRPESRQDRSCAHPDHVTPGAKPSWTKNTRLIGVHPACDNVTE